MTSLAARVLNAHARGDATALVHLYEEAANTAPDEDAKGFFLTQAHVYALETAHPDVARLRQMLIDMQRETPL